MRRKPLLAGWLFAIALMAAFAGAGFWQLGRATAKQAMLERSADVLAQRRPVALSTASNAQHAAGYDWAAGSGRFASSPALLLDNQQRNGRVGLRVYRLFQPDDGGELLVELGWLPWSREQPLPSLQLPAAVANRTTEVRGLLAPPPSPGIAMGDAMARVTGDRQPAQAWLATRIDLATVDRLVGDPARKLAPRVLRLDPALPIGYERDLILLANTLPPEKHRGYAVQWFGLALATLATALILTYRRSRR